jgi:predicted metalloendopeptidase
MMIDMINEEFGGWPILNRDQQNMTTTTTTTTTFDDSSHIINKLIQLFRVGSSQLFEFYVSSDPKNPKKNVLKTCQPAWFFNVEYLKDEEIMEAYEVYAISVIESILLFNQTWDKRESVLTDQSLKNDIKKIIELEKKFAAVIIFLLVTKINNT